MLKTPQLTADWKNALTLMSKGEYSMREFMGGIEAMVKGRFGAYCKNKCGMNVSRAMGADSRTGNKIKLSGGRKKFNGNLIEICV